MRGVECACRAYNLVIQVRTSKAITKNKKAIKDFTPKKSIKIIKTCLFGGDMKLMSPSIQNILGVSDTFRKPCIKEMVEICLMPLIYFLMILTLST